MPTPHPDSPDDLSTALRSVEDGVKKILRSGITRQAVLVLLAHETKLSADTISKVLNAATNLSKWTEPRR